MMASEEDAVKQLRVVEARVRNISHNVWCTECGNQSIEDSQADVAILLRKSMVSINNGLGMEPRRAAKGDRHLKLICDEIRAGTTDKDIYKKLQEDFGESVLYTPKFDLVTAALWLSPHLFAGVAGGIWAYNKCKQNNNVHVMALNLVRGVSPSPKEKQTMLDLLTPPPPERSMLSSWWKKRLGQ